MFFPRFRSRERDIRSDIERLSSIEAAIDRAIADAASERVGLANRLDDARSRAAFLFGDVIDGEADQKSTGMVSEAERFLVRGEHRRDELVEHFAILEDLKRRVSAALQPLIEEDAGR